MRVVPRNTSVVIGLTAVLVAVSFAAFANTDPRSPTGGIKTPPAALTVGALAKSLVSEIAVNAPTGGFDEVSSLGIMGAVGYKAGRSTDSPATVADLQAMLSVFGVKATSQGPSDSLSPERLGMTLSAMRSTLPHIRVPVSDRGPGVSPEADFNRPGSCLIAYLVCRFKCQQASPSGTGDGGVDGGCIASCDSQFRECRSLLGS